MKTVKIYSRNPMPTSGEIDYQDLINLWEEVETYFLTAVGAIAETVDARVLVDATEIKQMLSNLRPENVDQFFAGLYGKAESGRFPSSPFASGIGLKIVDGDFDSSHAFDSFVMRFVETLFLAMNLSRQGGCNLIYISTVDENGRQIDLGDLSDYIVEGAWHRSGVEGWPKLSHLTFSVTWEWLVKNGAFTYVLARTPTAKAIAVLTELSYSENLRLTDIVQVSHVLESLLLTKDEPRGRGIRRKTQAVLGAASQAESWANKFYKIRSEIVHGDYPIFYPRYSANDNDFEALSSHYWEINSVLLQGVAVVMALLQDMILSGSSRYQFEEKLAFTRTD